MAQQESTAAMEIAAEVRQGVIRLAGRMRARRSPAALSGTKLNVLAHLRRHGPATPGDLSATEHYPPQSLTRVLADLEQEGLITRTRHERDRRQWVLHLTASGLDAFNRDMAERDTWLSSALAGLTDTEREVLRLAGRLMDRIADTATAPGRSPELDSLPSATASPAPVRAPHPHTAPDATAAQTLTRAPHTAPDPAWRTAPSPTVGPGAAAPERAGARPSPAVRPRAGARPSPAVSD